MTKKIVLVSVLAILILTGAIFALSGRNTVESNPASPSFKTAQSSIKEGVFKTSESQSQGVQAGVQSTEQQNNATDKATGSVTWNKDRAERWQRAKNNPTLEQQIVELLNDGDLESPRFALYIKRICVLASGNQGLRSIPREGMSEAVKELNWQISEASIQRSLSISDKVLARCGNLGGLFVDNRLIDAITKSRAAGSALALAPTESKIGNDAQLTALNTVLRSPELAAVWLAERQFFFMKSAESAGYLEGLNGSEKNAVTWTVICNFGSDCADNGLSRLDACLSSDLCGGNSVAEAVADAVGKDKVQIIAARANRLGLDLAAAGSNFFKPRPK